MEFASKRLASPAHRFAFPLPVQLRRIIPSSRVHHRMGSPVGMVMQTRKWAELSALQRRVEPGRKVNVQKRFKVT